VTDATLTIDPATTALVLIDLQRGIVAADTFPIKSMEVVTRAARLAAACRDAGVTIILVHVDPGPDGILFPRVQADQPRPPLKPPADFAEFLPELGQQPSDVVVTKHQPNAFYNTDLEVQLIRRRIRTIILGGISTNLGVEATARSAHERAYEQIFVSDVMASRDGEMHDHTVRRVLPTMGRVRTLDTVLAALPDRGQTR
jgi:nicotinamidase-related amidase